MEKKKKLDKVILVKEMARERIGSPGTQRVVPNKRKAKLEEIREEEALKERT